MNFLKDLIEIIAINRSFGKKYWWQCTLVSVLIIGIPLLIDYIYYKKEEKELKEFLIGLHENNN